jgi:hypothetical protein
VSHRREYGQRARDTSRKLTAKRRFFTFSRMIIANRKRRVSIRAKSAHRGNRNKLSSQPYNLLAQIIESALNLKMKAIRQYNLGLDGA